MNQVIPALHQARGVWLCAGVLVALLAAPMLEAGVTYKFTTKQVTDRTKATSSGRIWASGPNYRLELTPPVGYDLSISRDRDLTAVFINRGAAMCRERPLDRAPIVSSRLFRLPAGNTGEARKPKIGHSVKKGLTIAGQPATLHTIDLEFQIVNQVSGMKVRGKVNAKAEVWVADRIAPLPLRGRDLRTGFQDLDERLAKISAQFKGMTLQHKLTVERQLHGGEASSEVTETTIDELEQLEIPESMFELPPGIACPGNSVAASR